MSYILSQYSNLLSFQANLNREVSGFKHVQDWCRANKLTINPTKYNSLIICPKINTSITEFSITLEDSSIETEEIAKYLGILIDSKLNFKYHLNLVESKLSRAIGI